MKITYRGSEILLYIDLDLRRYMLSIDDQHFSYGIDDTQCGNVMRSQSIPELIALVKDFTFKD